MRSISSPKQAWLTILVALFAAIVLTNGARGAVPEISHIQDVFIMGENFDGEGVQVRTWQPPREQGEADAIAAALAGDLEIPSEPPKDAKAVGIVDAESQVLTTELSNAWDRFSVQYVWVGNSDGWSKPYVIGKARPFWISETKPEPGKALHMYGFNLRAVIGGADPLFLMKGADGQLLEMASRNDPLGIRTKDPHLVFFQVPRDAKPGEYEVFVNNNLGGLHGWSSAGQIEVVPPKPEAKVYRASEHGVTGDGLTDDAEALQALVEKVSADGGGVVFLPPGTYSISRTLILRPDVVLRGAAAGNTFLQGAGYDPEGPRNFWYSTDPVPASVLMMQNRTGVESLTITGTVSEGLGGRGLVQTLPEDLTVPGGGFVERIHIRNSVLQSTAVDPEFGAMLYRGGTAFFIGHDAYSVELDNNTVYGSIAFGQKRKVERAEVKRNIMHGGAISGDVYDSLMEGNIFKDAPSRFLFYGRSHSYARFNEMHLYSQDSWTNAPEPFLIHGGGPKQVGSPTEVRPNGLTDLRQTWAPDQFKNDWILITAGRGFGQYRRVVGNDVNSIEIEEPWRVQPDAESEYVMGDFYVESALFANLNNSVGVTSLWLDCIGIRVIRQRDFNATGVNIWGRVLAHRNEKGEILSPGNFNPSWYNLIADNWMDGSTMQFYCGDFPDRLYRGPSMFANVLYDNRLRYAFQQRMAHTTKNTGRGAVEVGGGSSHTRIANNLITHNPVGVYVMPKSQPGNPIPAFKTFITGNLFEEVAEPLLDGGKGTWFVGNKKVLLTVDGPVEEPLEEVRGKAEPINRSLVEALPEAPKKIERERPVNFVDPGTQNFLSYLSFERAAVASEEVKKADQENLRALLTLLREYQKKNGALPEARLLTVSPGKDEGSLGVILGEQARPHLVSPGSGSELREAGWLTYIWNEELNGKRLEDVENPSQTWVLMDMIALHPFLVKHGHAGYQGGVNVLFADGEVRWVTADEIPFP